MPAAVKPFAAESFNYPIDNDTITTFQSIWERLAQPGYWWTAQQRIAIAQVARDAVPRDLMNRQREEPGKLSTDTDASGLSPLVVDTIERITTESGALSGEWCAAVCERLGEGAYGEMVAIVILLVPIDRFCLYLGRELEPFPEPMPGEPSREYPDDLVDNGAWIRQTAAAVADKELVNVSRAVSIVPAENTLRRQLVDALYMQGHSFFDTVWERKALSRAQLELVATRTSSINQCFYCATGHSLILEMTSKAIGQDVDLALAQEGGQGAASSAIPEAERLLAFTEVANREPTQAHGEFQQLVERLGAKGAIEVAATVAIFNGLNRTSDPTGVPMEDVILAAMGNKIERLQLDQLTGVAHVNRPTLWQRIKILVAFKIRRLLKGGQ